MTSAHIALLTLAIMPFAVSWAQTNVEPPTISDLDPSAEAISYRNRIVPIASDEMDESEKGRLVNKNKQRLLRGSHVASGEDAPPAQLTGLSFSKKKAPQGRSAQVSALISPITMTQTDPVGSTSVAEADDTSSNLLKIEELYIRSLKIREKSLGPEHLDVANSLNNLADFYKENGKLNQAKTLYERALGILEKNLGPDHPDVASALDNIASLYRQTHSD